MNKKALSVVHVIADFFNKSLIKNLLITTLAILLVFVQIFYPYQFYSSADRNGNSNFEVGIHYVYEQDDLNQIYSQVTQIYDLGFKAIRITLECDPTDYSHIQNQKTDAFFSGTDQYGLAVALVIQNLDLADKVNYYLDRWGTHLSYIQVMNEPESSSTWSVGSIFSDDEIISTFDNMYAIVAAHNLPAKLYTNFGIGYSLRSNIPITLGQKLDFVGLDIFMDSFLILSPHFIENLRKITNRDVMITEFGMSTINSQVQSDFIIKGLNLFKSMGLNGCWLVYWNSEFDNYGIRGRLAQQTVGEWIASNA